MGVGDEEDVEVLQRGVDEANARSFKDGVLRSWRDEAGERGEEGFEARTREAEELA